MRIVVIVVAIFALIAIALLFLLFTTCAFSGSLNSSDRFFFAFGAFVLLAVLSGGLMFVGKQIKELNSHSRGDN